MNTFVDRTDAGRQLAERLRPYASERPIILALPRGGVPVGYEIARALHAPLDVWVVRKVGVPWQPELGMGAVAEGGYVHLNREVLGQLRLVEHERADAARAKREEAIQAKLREVEERVRRFRGARPRPDLRGRTAIVVDDGIATGGTVLAAIDSIRAQTPSGILLAVPVAAPETLRMLASAVDRVFCLKTPANLQAVGLWYANFNQTPDEEVARLLEQARGESRGEQGEVEHASR